MCRSVSVALSVQPNCARQNVDTFVYSMAVNIAKEYTIEIIASQTFDLTTFVAFMSAPVFSRISVLVVSPLCAAP